MTGRTVAYVVVAWNNRDLLQGCIESIEAQDHPHKRILVVDNGSSDGTVTYLREAFPQVEVLPQGRNLGFTGGNNVGIRRAVQDPDVDFVALINTDATLDPDWTGTLIGFAERKPNGAAFQSMTLDYHDHDVIDSTHIFVSHRGQGTQGSWRRLAMADHDVAPSSVFGCNAAAVLLRREFIDAQPFEQFFDERLFMYLEDVDVAFRALVMGWDNHVVPGTRAYHMGSASSSKRTGWSLYMTFRNNLGLLMKNAPGPILWRVLPRMALADVATIRHLVATDQRHLISPVVRGRLAGLLRIPHFLRMRRVLAQHAVADPEELWALMERGFR